MRQTPLLDAIDDILDHAPYLDEMTPMGTVAMPISKLMRIKRAREAEREGRVQRIGGAG